MGIPSSAQGRIAQPRHARRGFACLPYVACCLLPWLPPALAQMPAAPGAAPAAAGGVAAPLAAPGVGGAGGDAAPQRAWAIRPRFSATETFTDNAVVSAAGRQADQITTLSPGIRLEGNTGRLKLFTDYSLNYFTAAKGTQANRTTNSLNSFGTLEALNRWLYIDASAVITQQNISAFGAQTAGSATVSNNSTETSSFRLSPYIRGNLARIASYEVRYTHSETGSKSGLASDVKSDDFAFRLRGLGVPFGLGWSADATRQEVAYGSGRRSQADRLNGILSYRFDPQFQLRASVGAENNDFASATPEWRTTFGYGGDWSPTERTQLSVFRERRFFGNGHTITFSHRLPLTAIRFTDTRNVSVLPNQLGAPAGQGTYYDLLFAQLAATIPDPVARAQQVTTQLQQSGIAPNAAITNGFLTSRATVQRRQEISLVLNGLRNTVTYTFFQSEQQSTSAGAAAGSGDDFSTSTSVRQRGMSSNLSHRLSPLTTLNMLSSVSKSGGSTAQSTTSRVFNLNASTRLGVRTTGSVGLRSTRTEGGTIPYRENALLATVSATF